MFKIGIDIGGVIIDRANDNTDTSFFSDNYLNTTAVPGAVSAIAKLVKLVGAENVFIVSKAGERTTKRSREWLLHWNFYQRTGMKPENVFFCAERADKAPICERLGIDIFIDDKLEVLSYLKTVTYKIGFQVRPYERKKWMNDPVSDEVILFDTWTEVVNYIPLALKVLKRFLTEDDQARR